MSGSYYTLNSKYNQLRSLLAGIPITGSGLTGDLNANNYDILNVDNITLNTINGLPPAGAENLEQTLTIGDDANGLNIQNLNQLGLQGGSTITDTTGDLVLQPPTNQTIQLGNNIYVDTQNNRVGINVPAPTEDLEIDGNIQMNTGGTSKIVFYDSPNAHEHGEIDAEGELTNGGVIKFQTKVDGGSVTEKLRINNAGAIGLMGAVYGGTNQTIISQGSTLPPRWRNNYPNIVSGFPITPPANLYGDQILFNFTGSGNIGAYMPMIWNGVTWKVIGSTILCRWVSGSASQVINSTSITNITTGDYGSRTFTPPITGYYEVGQTMFKVELNSGISVYTYLSATDGSENWRLYSTEDWNGPYQHWRAGISCPIVVPLQSTKTYRFTANLSYAVGNTATLFTAGYSYVKAVAS